MTEDEARLEAVKQDLAAMKIAYEEFLYGKEDDIIN